MTSNMQERAKSMSSPLYGLQAPYHLPLSQTVPFFASVIFGSCAMALPARQKFLTGTLAGLAVGRMLVTAWWASCPLAASARWPQCLGRVG